MKLSGWGRYPVIDSVRLNQKDYFSSKDWSLPFIPVGNLRSYGDAALSKFHLTMRNEDKLISFDERTGMLTCDAGILLSEIIDIFLPRGWFLAVTPGSKMITIGGAVASDVHGKNHHVQGCFSECVESFDLALPDGEIKTCSRIENSHWFYATCGGMGLTGVITQVSFYLKRVQSQWVEQSTIKTTNLRETFDAFELYNYLEYSVAWIDCLASGDNLGRSLLTVGDFAQDGDFDYKPRKTFSIPFNLPSLTLNKFSVKTFNALYYGKIKIGESYQRVGLDSFFYPLDSIDQWNRIYGKKGFVQFQFILPKVVSFEGLESILKSISKSGMGSFLAVLKLYGANNHNLLSFPMEGYSLALDFKLQAGLVEFIRKLTDEVIEFGGRVYLAKDALLTREQFQKSYPKVEQFREFRQEMGLKPYFQSMLSQRLGL